MTSLRPECGNGKPGSALPKDTSIYLISKSVFRRRSLIHGRLHDGEGKHCAMGCFWQDNPTLTVPSDLLEEVAAVNDSLPKSATPQKRWKGVTKWLRWKMRVLEAGK